MGNDLLLLGAALALALVCVVVLNVILPFRVRAMAAKHLGLPKEIIPLPEVNEVSLDFQLSITKCLQKLGEAVSVACINQIEAEYDAAPPIGLKEVDDALELAIRKYHEMHWAATFYQVQAPSVDHYRKVISPHFAIPTQ